jgi:hypothetical protein
MGKLLSLPSVVYADPVPLAGRAILIALDIVAESLPYDLTVTSATDGVHSGPEDPHHFGLAYDVRSHGLPDKQTVLHAVMRQLATQGEEPTEGSGGLLTEKFFGWLEALGQANEHFHFQLRHGIEYP